VARVSPQTTPRSTNYVSSGEACACASSGQRPRPRDCPDEAWNRRVRRRARKRRYGRRRCTLRRRQRHASSEETSVHAPEDMEREEEFVMGEREQLIVVRNHRCALCTDALRIEDENGKRGVACNVRLYVDYVDNSRTH
jgi:hypothetical protein